jgi:hypothetical protein
MVVEPLGPDAVSCQWVDFPKSFDAVATGHNAKVVMSVSSSDHGQLFSSRGWVQATKTDKFEVCIDENDIDGERDLRINYLAFDTTKANTQVLTGSAGIGHIKQHLTHCKTIPFAFIMTTPGFVAGSIEVNSGLFYVPKSHLNMYHWITNIQHDKFDACVMTDSALSPKDEVTFNYAAAMTKFPVSEFNDPLFSAAGVTDMGRFTGTKCQLQVFSQSFEEVPTVLVTAEAFFLPNSPKNNLPVMATIKTIGLDSFTVCIAAKAFPDDERQARVHWIAFDSQKTLTH